MIEVNRGLTISWQRCNMFQDLTCG